MKNETIERLKKQLQIIEKQLQYFENREADLRDKIALCYDFKRQLQEQKQQITQTIKETEYRKGLFGYYYVLPYAC